MNESRGLGPGLLAVGIGASMGYAAVLVYVVSITAPHATHGSLNALELLPMVGAVPMAVGIGAALGSVLPPLLAPVVAAVVPYVAYGAAGYADSYAGRLLFADLLPMDDTSRDHLRVPTDLLLFKSIFGLGLGMALVSLLLRARRTAYGTTFIAGLGLAGVFLVGGVRIEVPQTYAAVCSAGRPMVCVDRTHDHLLAEYRRRLTDGIGQLDGLDLDDAVFTPAPELFAESAQMAKQPVDLGGRLQIVAPLADGNTDPAHQIDGSQFLAELGFGIFMNPCATTGLRPGSANSMLYLWWLTINHLLTDGSNFAGEPPSPLLVGEDPTVVQRGRQFAALSQTDRARWFTDHRTEVLACAALAVNSP